jgi:tRNA threonylcarbamoyladenosine biosynthesis protein TsaE
MRSRADGNAFRTGIHVDTGTSAAGSTATADIAEMPARSFVTHSPEETIELGRKIASELQPPALVLLRGELGAGKTTLTKGIAAGLGAAAEEAVTSPTFTLIHEYGGAGERGGLRVYHVDLYRIENARELETLGLEDLLAERALVIIEWAEKLGPALRQFAPGRPVVEIRLTAPTDTERRIEIQKTEAGSQESE